jgi:hypothetical protein
MFDNMGTEQHEEKARDFVGYTPHETDLYKAKVKLAYLSIAKSGARSIVFEFDLGNDKILKSNQLISNKKGENFFINKKTQKKAPLAGFTVVDNLCFFATGQGLKGQRTEEKMLKLYNFELKKDVPTNVHVLVDLIDKEVGLAVWKTLENKQVEQNGEWVDTSEERTVNDIEKVLHPTNAATYQEFEEKKDPTWAANWAKRNRGQLRDKRSIKDGKGGPPKAGGGTPSGTGGGSRPSIFGGGS